jgi:uncharacterized membrane protein YfhO
VHTPVSARKTSPAPSSTGGEKSRATIAGRARRILGSDVLLVVLVLCVGMTVFLMIRRPPRSTLKRTLFPYTTPIWSGEIPDERLRTAQNYLLSDQIKQFYPWHHLAADTMQNTGKIPLWNPYEFTGQPLVANAQSALFYPPNLLLFWLTPGQVANVRAVFNIFLAGVLTFLLCRALGLGRTGCTLAAIGFAFSGPLIAFLGHPHANALACLPLLMWAAERILDAERKMVWIGVAGLGVGLCTLGGHPQTAFHVLLVVSCYLVLRAIARGGPGTARPLIAFAAAVSVGLLIGAVQLVPFAEFLFDSSTVEQGRGVGGEPSFYSEKWLGNAATSATLVYPNFFGNPTTRNYIMPLPGPGNYNEQAIYFGLIPFTFAVGALFVRGKPWVVWILVLLALFCVGVAWRLPGFEAVNHLPGFSLISNSRLRWIFTFLCAVLAAYGYERWRDSIRNSGDERAVSRAVLVVPILAIVVFLAVGVVKSVVLARELYEPAGTPLQMTFGNYLLFNIFAWGRMRTMVTVLVAAGALIGFALLHKRALDPSSLGHGLVALTLIELIVVGWGYNPTIDERRILPSAAALEVVSSDAEPYRVIASREVHLPNFNVVHRIPHLGGYDLPVSRRYSDLYRAGGRAKVYNHSWEPTRSLVSALNAKYLITSRPIDHEPFELIHESRSVKVYENHDVLPRAYVVHAVEVVNDDAMLLERVLDETREFRDGVLLERSLPPRQTAEIARSHGGESSVRFVSLGTDEVEIDVTTATAGVLVMSDLFAPGWKAYLDEREVELHRANYAQRAVFVPAGGHSVRFSYRPLSFRIGAVCSLVGLTLGLIASAAFLVCRRTRRYSSEIGKTGCVFGTSDTHGSVKSEPMRE